MGICIILRDGQGGQGFVKTAGKNFEMIDDEMTDGEYLGEEDQSEFYLTPIEAIRVSAVIDMSIEKLQLLSMLSADIRTSDLSPSQLRKQDEMGDNPTTVGNILEEQQKLGKLYEQLSSERGSENPRLSKEDETRERKLREIFKNLKENTKILCRNLKETPNETSNWKKIKNERSEIQTVLEDCRKELIDGVFSGRDDGMMENVFDTDPSKQPKTQYSHIMDSTSDSPTDMDSPNTPSLSRRIRYDNFLEKINGELAEKRSLKEIISREKATQEKVRELRRHVEEERKFKEEEVLSKTKEMTLLMNQLRQMKQESEEKYEKHVATERAKFETTRRIQQSEIQRLDEEFRRLTIQLDIEEKVYRQTKSFLGFKNHDLEDEASKWSDKLEQERDQMKDQVSEWRDKSLDRERRKERLTIEFDTEEHHKREREKSDREIAELKRLEREDRESRAATRIKLCWLAYCDRKLFEDMKKVRRKR